MLYTEIKMKKIFIISLTLFVFCLLLGVPVSAQQRYAYCDLCGFCQNATAPSTWLNCKKCLYPQVTSDNPDDYETLLVDPSTNAPPAPALGRQYTIIGCINTDISSLTTTGSTPGFIQIILQIILTLTGGIALLYLIYGAYLILTSQANAERLDHGKRVVYSAIVGLVFSLSVVLIINLIASGILKIPGFAP